MRLLTFVMKVMVLSTILLSTNLIAHADDGASVASDVEDEESVDLGEINLNDDGDAHEKIDAPLKQDQSFIYEMTADDEERLDKEDAKYTEAQLATKMSVCFNSVQHLLVTQHESYKKFAQSIAEQEGVREDDALRMIMYTNIVGCYNILSVEDAEKYSKSQTFDEEFYNMISPQNRKTPPRLTEKQSKLFTKVITQQTASKASAPVFQQLTGRVGYLYMVMAVVFMMGGIALVVQYLGKQHTPKTKSQSSKKKSRKNK